MRIVGFGGTMRPGSSSEQVLRAVLDRVAGQGAEVELFDAPRLDFPLYSPGATMPTAPVVEFLEAIRAADGIVVASPGYHGDVSGLVKNAIDWVEELRTDARPYFDSRPVGLIVVAAGWQATVTTLSSLRSIVHALRGWPTPFGLAINAADPAPVDPAQIELLATQVLRGRALGGTLAAPQAPDQL